MEIEACLDNYGDAISPVLASIHTAQIFKSGQTQSSIAGLDGKLAD
jgi:hypothetical protein